MRMSTIVGVAAFVGTASGTAIEQTRVEPIRSGFGAGAYPAGAAHSNLLKVVEPVYPPAAIQAGIRGDVLLEAVVGPKGSITDLRVTKSLDVASGIDDSAVAAVRKWTFRPATIGGKPVSVVVRARVPGSFCKYPVNPESRRHSLNPVRTILHLSFHLTFHQAPYGATHQV